LTFRPLNVVPCHQCHGFPSCPLSACYTFPFLTQESGMGETNDGYQCLISPNYRSRGIKTVSVSHTDTAVKTTTISVINFKAICSTAINNNNISTALTVVACLVLQQTFQHVSFHLLTSCHTK